MTLRKMFQLVGLGVLIASSLPSVVAGQFPTPTPAPTYSVPNGKSGWKVETQTLALGGDQGNTVLRVRLTRQPPLPAGVDEVFTISLGPSYAQNRGATNMAELVVPAGQVSADAELYYNSTNSYNYYYNLQLSIDSGNPRRMRTTDDLMTLQNVPTLRTGISARASIWLSYQASTPPAVSGTHYFWDGMPQQYRRLSFATNVGAVQPTTVQNQMSFLNVLWSQGGQWEAVENLWMHPDDLPLSWKGLTAAGSVVMTLPDYQKLCKEAPSKRAVLRDWVTAGGILVVVDPKGQGLEFAKQVRPLLEDASGDQVKSGQFRGLLPEIYKGEAVRLASDELGSTDLDAVLEDYAAGVIVSSTGRSNLVPMVKRFSESRRMRPTTPNVNGSDALTSPLEGYGEPPLGIFACLLGVFLFLVGPVMLLYVRYRAKNQRLYLAVPVFSFLLCFSILSYAAITDYGKQVGRADTITVLEQRSGRAYTQATAAYYCGAQPAYYEFDPGVDISLNSQQRDWWSVDLRNDFLRLSSSRIAPRKVHKLFVHQPTETDQRINVRDVDGQVQFVNGLGTVIRAVVFEHQGKYYQAKDIADGSTAIAKEISGDLALSDQLPGLLPEDGLFRGIEFYGECLAWQFRSSSNGRIINSLLQPGEFVALTESDPNTDSLLQPFNYQHKTHIIYGR